MEERPLQIEYETEFIERFEMFRSELGLDSIRPNLRKDKQLALISGVLFLLVSISASSLILYLLNIPLSTPFHAVYVSTMLIWGFIWLYRHVLAESIQLFLIKRVFEFSCRLKGPGIDGFSMIEISDDTLFINNPYSSTLYRWPCLWDINRSKDWTILKFIDFKTMIIPNRAFDSDEHYEWLIDEIERRNTDAGGADHFITQYLNDHTLACPKCKYPLHQIPQARCPECGREINYTDFKYNTTELAIIPEDLRVFVERTDP